MRTLPADSSLSLNPMVRVFREVRLPLLGLPLLGYAMSGGIAGALHGTAVLGGLWLGYGGLLLNLRRQTRIFRRKHMKSFCPVCLAPLEGRQVCPFCDAELPAAAYVPGTCLIHHCPACGKRLGKGSGKPRHRCFSETCGNDGDPERRRWVECFSAKTTHYRIVLVGEGWEPGNGWETLTRSDSAVTYVKAGGSHAVLLDVRESALLGGEGISNRVHDLASGVWVHRGVPVNALQALKQIQTGQGFRLSFEASPEEMGTDFYGFSGVMCGVSIGDWMAEAEKIIQTPRNGSKP